MNTSGNIIQLRNISKTFGEKKVLEDISLDIHANEITAIIGKSGVGKSVLVKHIVGLIQPDQGEIFFADKPYSSMSRRDFSEIKRKCSYMFQNNALFDSLTVFENIALPLREQRTFPPKIVEEKVWKRIEQLDLHEAADKFPKQLSGGMQKRVALARALSIDPEIIFFDEPTTGLDPIRRNAVFSMIHTYHQRFNFTAVIITHDVPDIFHIAQKVHILEEGRLIFSGTPVELEQSQDSRHFVYTHGHELLLDDLSGLHHRLQLAEEIKERKALREQYSLLTLRFRNLRTLVDYRGNVVAQKVLACFVNLLHQVLGRETFKAKYSQDVVACLVAVDDPERYTQIQQRIQQMLGDSRMSRLFVQNSLKIEIGKILVDGPEDSDELVAKALQTAIPMN